MHVRMKAFTMAQSGSSPISRTKRLADTTSATTQERALNRMHPMLRVVRAVAVALVIGLIFKSFGCSERLFFYPHRSAFVTPPGIEDVTFTNGEGHTLHGWFIPPEGNPPGSWPAVLHVHGNAGNLTHHVAFCKWLTEHGYAVMLFDYRSYGRSDKGSLSRDGVLADAHAALDTLLERPDIDRSRVALFGFSLGGATATRLMAERTEPVAIVAGAPFSSWQVVAGDYAPGISRIMVRTGGDPQDAITKIGQRPVLLVHGDADGIVRPYHTERLLAAAESAGVPVRRELFAGLDHNSLLMDDQVRERIRIFLDDALADSPVGD